MSLSLTADAASSARRDDAADLLRDIAALVAFGPRLAGSPAERAAAGYIVDALTAEGLSPELLSFEGYVSQPAAAGSVAAADGRRIPGKGVAFAASTPPGGLTAPLGRLDAPGRLDGRIALVRGLAHHAVLEAASARGAVGVIGISAEDNAHYWQISPLWGSPTGPDQLARFASIPALQVSRSDGERLEALRQTGDPVRLVAEVVAGWRPLTMPTVQIPGREPGYLLVAGHFCSWGPGASDNAAGNALMLDLARHFARGPQPRFGLRLLWLTGHEQGGYAGSGFFSDLHHTDLARNAIGYVNVDNVGSRGAGLWLVQNTSAELDAFARQVRDRLVPPLTPAQRRFGASLQKRADRDIPVSRPARNGDQSFAGIGLPSLQIASWLDEDHPDRIPGTGLPWWWHTDADTADKCGADVLATDRALHRALVDGLINADRLPFDLAAQADDLLTALAVYQEAAPEIPALARIGTAARDYRARLAAVTPDDATALALVKRLNGVLFHALSETEFDMTRDSRLLPGLAPALGWTAADADGRRMIAIRVTRAANRILRALDDCRGLLGP